MRNKLNYRIYFDYTGRDGESEKMRYPELIRQLGKYGSLEDSLQNSDVVVIGSHKEHRLPAECEMEKALALQKPVLYLQNEGDKNVRLRTYSDSGITYVHYGKIEQATGAIDDFFENLQFQSVKKAEKITEPNIPAPHLRD